jgi:hypothetical protein
MILPIVSLLLYHIHQCFMLQVAVVCYAVSRVTSKVMRSTSGDGRV